jgi:hypothetical protein
MFFRKSVDYHRDNLSGQADRWSWKHPGGRDKYVSFVLNHRFGLASRYAWPGRWKFDGGAMLWESLASPVHVARYSDGESGSDWSPMRRVAGALAVREYAPLLFAYKSLERFCITFSPAYDGQWSGPGVLLSFDVRKRLFTVHYEGMSNQDEATYTCEEFEVGRLLDSLVLRMRLTRSGSADVALESRAAFHHPVSPTLLPP